MFCRGTTTNGFLELHIIKSVSSGRRTGIARSASRGHCCRASRSHSSSSLSFARAMNLSACAALSLATLWHRAHDSPRLRA